MDTTKGKKLVIIGTWIGMLNFIIVAGANNECSIPFYCNDNTCKHRYLFCNGFPDCPEGEDEIIYNASIHNSSHGIACVPRFNGNSDTCLLPNDYLCDHELDCKDGADECNCASAFKCNNGDCAVKVLFCDGNNDCADGSDEILYNKTGFQCPVTKLHLTSNCVLPDIHVCDGDSECNWGTDECFCKFIKGKRKGIPLDDEFSNDKCFRCLDGSLVIPNIHVCDGIVHCKDLSDECLCQHKTTQLEEFCGTVCTGPDCGCPGQILCQPNSVGSEESICVSPDSICDDRVDCMNGLDENFCALDTESFSCKDGKSKIRKRYVCDGVADCEDQSDEDFCHDEMYICKLYRNPRYINLSGWDDPETYPKLNRTVLGEKFKHTWPYYAAPCDGVPLCEDMSDECNEELCHGKTELGFCENFRNHTCSNSGSIITGYEICDGQPTCNDTAPETSEDEKYCTGRFYCENRGATRLPIHIPMKNKCDGRQECDDQSDEMNCNTTTHFYCEDGGSTKFISRDQVCDKRKDCKGGSDECQGCERDPFSSEEKLIKSIVLRVFLWIIGLLSTSGNVAIIIHQIVNLAKLNRDANQVAIKNRILVLNLAAADLLVGIYLISLGIKDATIGRYCLLDQEWRSSHTCNGLGAVAVIGTQASVMILLIMTFYRLYLVYQPFRQQKMSTIIVALIFAWVVAIILATVPLASSAQEYFLSCVWYRNHRYLGYACKSTIADFTKKLITFEGPSKLFSSVVGGTFSWEAMLAAQQVLNSSYVPERYFGYYSAHSVCLPRLFPDRKDDLSWGYSLLLVLFNFCAFVCILLGYIVIYRRTTQSKVTTASSSEDRATVLQKKVTRIVLTDFCCWMPICIMAFIRVAGVKLGDEAYAVTAIILLPINSAMNPFLYSSLIDVIWKNARPFRKWFYGSSVGRSIKKRRSSKRSHSETAKSMKLLDSQVMDESSKSGFACSLDEIPGN